MDFARTLKDSLDITRVVGEYVTLKKAGARYVAPCPFHTEKTPSFGVSPSLQIFKCFGCGAGGDVLKFVELHQKLPFPEAVRFLAARAGIQVPESDGGPEDRAAAALREALLKVHELAAAFYRERLASPAGARARKELEQRGLRPETIETFGYGYAPAAGRDSLHAHLANQKVPDEVLIKGGLVVQRDALGVLREEATAERRHELVLLDPPYERWADLEERLGALVPRVVAEPGVVVVETDAALEPTLPLALRTTRRYGSARLTIFHP